MKKLRPLPLLSVISVLNFYFLSIPLFSQTEKCELVGRVVEKNTGNTIIGAVITIPGTAFGAVSDVMGEYRISLPDGNYNIECRMVSYAPIQIQDVNTQGKRKIQLDFVLEDATQEGSTLEIFEYRQTNTEAAVLMEMKEAKGVVSGMSSAQIAKGQDRDASQVARRIPGVTIVDNRFVMVRGLSSRYNATMINGVLAPSLEADARAFSFDIIPSAAIDRFLIFKSPSADLPGEFAGGAINVITKNFPDDKSSIDFSYTQGFRSGTTGKPFVTNGQNGSELLALGTKDRALPSDFPSDLKLITDNTEKLKWTQALSNDWGIQNYIAPLDQRFNLTIGKKQSLKKVVFGNYTSIEYGGIPFQPNSEINGLTMCGVGSGTIIDHVQVSYCGDDAFEWFGGTVTLTSSQNNGNNWSNGGIDNTITVGTSGNYFATYTDNNGCSATSNIINVLVNALPQVSISANGNTSFCTGGSVTLSSNQNTGNLWSNGQNTTNIVVTNTGNYSVVVTDNNGCQNNSNIISVSVSDAPAPTAAVSGNNVFCAGQSANIQSSIADSYQWYLNGNAITGANGSNLNVTEGGFYTVETTNANACDGTGFSNPVFITVNALPSVSLTAIGNTTFCDGNQVTLLCNQGTGTIWSNGAIDVSSSTIANTGSFTVNYTDNNGCSNTSNTIEVTVHSNPSISINANGPTTFCDGGSVTLSSSATGNNIWNGGISADHIDVTTSGTYELTFTDANGCQATASTDVMVNNQPSADFSILQNNGSFIIQFLNNSNNATGYTWDFGDGSTSQETNPSHLYTTGGDFVVTLTASNGDCNDVFTFNVNNVSVEENQAQVINIYPNPSHSFINIQTPIQTQLMIMDITGKQIMNFNTTASTTNLDIDKLPAGLYVVKGYNMNGTFTAKFEKQ